MVKWESEMCGRSDIWDYVGGGISSGISSEQIFVSSGDGQVDKLG